MPDKCWRNSVRLNQVSTTHCHDDKKIRFWEWEVSIKKGSDTPSLLCSVNKLLNWNLSGSAFALFIAIANLKNCFKSLLISKDYQLVHTNSSCWWAKKNFYIILYRVQVTVFPWRNVTRVTDQRRTGYVTMRGIRTSAARTRMSYY